jgi:hypothetical protein
MAFNSAPVTAAALDAFVAAITAKGTEYLDRSGATWGVAFVAERGPKNIRIIRKDVYNGVAQEHGSAHCFIEAATGHILKAAGYKAPAKHARGTIHTPTFGAEYVGPYGPAYLR